MKYRVIKSNVDESFDVITEDGGCTYIYYGDSRWVSNYYKGRIGDLKGREEEFWMELQDMGLYVNTWEDKEPTEEELIQDALDWMVFPSPSSWEVDEALFDNIFKTSKPC